ncbi:MAG: pentapeptide repeat-containing protein [Cyanobacteria bacterium J06626_18]
MNLRSRQLYAMNSEKAQDDQTQGANQRGGKPNLQDRHFRRTNLREAYLWDANFEDAYLREANFQEAYLWQANLQNTYLLEANFQGAYLGKANFCEAHLWEANLQNAYLGNANFQGADLWQADLRHAYLGRANFQGAVLTNVNFKGAILLATDLTCVIDLDMRQLEGEQAPYLCAVELPDGVDIDPNRDRDRLPQILVEHYPFWYQTLEEARAHVNRVMHRRHS